LPLFTKTGSELVTKSDQWYYFLKHLENFERIPAVLSEPIFERAFEIVKLAKMTPQEKSQYEANLMIARNNYAVLETAMDKSFKQGLESGIEKGIAQEKTEVAKKLKQMGLDTANIAQATGLTAEEINNITF
jgi:predicted transposase/invertase (TIGR01784 family)